MQPSDGMILVIGPRLEGHSVIFLAIQTHLSCRFLLAVDSLGLRRSGSSSQIINQAQDFPEQVPRHRLSLPFIPSIAETLEFCITTGYPFRHA